MPQPLGFLTPADATRIPPLQIDQPSERYYATARGAGAITTAWLGTARGSCRLAYDSYLATARGTAAGLLVFVATARGACTLGDVTTYLATARGTAICYAPLHATARGANAALAAFLATARGADAVMADWLATARGSNIAGWDSWLATARGTAVDLAAQLVTARGAGRIADALARYELFRGVDEAADLAAAAWETFTTLPHATDPLDPSHTYHFVLRLRNSWALESQNITEWTVTVGADGTQSVTHPSDPFDVAIEPAAAGAVLVTASYAYREDGNDAATRWLVYLTSNGIDPVPGVDSPTVVTMKKADGIARLRWTSSAFADGLTIKVLVRTRRIDAGPVNADSTNTDVASTTSDTDGPVAVAGDIMFGKIFRQEQ